MTDIRELADLFRYLMFVALDGDFANDWLTHLPAVTRAAVSHLAHVIYWKG